MCGARDAEESEVATALRTDGRCDPKAEYFAAREAGEEREERVDATQHIDAPARVFRGGEGETLKNERLGWTVTGES